MEKESLRELQLIELDLFKKFAAFCDKNQITYFAMGGTLLGAVRHKGFIPWDDDMDVGIPREEYERFIRLHRKQKPDFTVHTFKNDPKHKECFLKLQDARVMVRMSVGSARVATVTPAWIDVFPLDGMPNSGILRMLWKYYLLYRRAMYKLSNFDRVVDVSNKKRPWVERFLIKLGLHFPVQRLLNVDRQLVKLDRAMKRFPYAKSDYLVNVMGAWKFKEMFHKKYYGKGRWYAFEDTSIRGPVDYDTICTQLYGDYMVPPKEAHRNHHRSEIIRQGNMPDI